MAIKKLGLDLGNSTIKFVSSEDGVIKKHFIASAFDIRSGNITSTNDKGANITIGDKTIFLGEGIPLNAIDKTNREYFEHQVLYAAWKSFGAGSYVLKLATGLPIKLYKTKGQEFENKLKDIVKIQGKVNGENVTINLDSVKVCSEGFSSLFSLIDKINKLTPTLIIDIGYKTTDTLLVRWDEELQQFIVEQFDTENIGLYDFLKLMSEKLLSEGVDIKPEEINKRLKSPNSILRTEKGTVNLAKSLSFASERFEQLIRSLELTYGQLFQYDLLYTGGGSKLFLDGVGGSDRFKSLIKLEDDVKYYSNADGYLEQITDED